MPKRVYTRSEVARLAALSRAYRESFGDINAAIMQEMMIDLDPEHRAEVGIRFGLSEEEFTQYLPEEVLRLCDGFIHRAGLREAEEVLAEVKLHIELGRLKPGDQLPPRTTFTSTYHCGKGVHGEVVTQLIRDGLVCRSKIRGGPLYITHPPFKE